MSKAPSLSRHPGQFQAALLDWYHSARRSLPWREQPSLYGTVVSEFMLQQTQVKTVLPYYDRWMNALPDFESLAAASEERVLKLWEGLGYYSRARNLHRLAKEILLLDPPPRGPADWLELPGIGPYTAAAISSIAFGEPAACVDGNVVRILARLCADSRQFRDGASAAKSFAETARRLLNTENPGDHNQAMMELGATLCTRLSPRCTLCPVSAWCKAFALGRPEDYPKLEGKNIEKRQVLRALCVQKGKILLHRSSAGARQLANLMEVPDNRQLGLAEKAFATLPFLLRKRRGITRFQITESFHRLSLAPSPLPPNLSWIPLKKLDAVTLSGPHRKWLTELLAMNKL